MSAEKSTAIAPRPPRLEGRFLLFPLAFRHWAATCHALVRSVAFRRGMVHCGLLGLVMAVGCQSLKLPPPPVEDVKPRRELRREQAIQSYQRQRDTVQYEAALTQAELGDLEGAKEHLTQLLRRKPKHREGQLLLAEVHLAEERPDQAQKPLENVLAHNPNDAAAHHLLGLTLEAKRQTADAQEHFRKAVELKPDAELYRVTYEASVAADSAGQPRGPMSGGPGSQVALAQHENGLPPDPGQLRAAVGAQQTLLPIDEAVRHCQQGRADEAVAKFRQALAMEPDNPRLPVAASAYLLKCGHSASAAQLAGEATRWHPNQAALRRVYGAACLVLGDLQNAETSLRYAVSLDKSDALSYFLLGSTLIEAGKPEAARQPLAEAHRLDSRFPSAR